MNMLKESWLLPRAWELPLHSQLQLSGLLFVLSLVTLDLVRLDTSVRKSCRRLDLPKVPTTWST